MEKEPPTLVKERKSSEIEYKTPIEQSPIKHKRQFTFNEKTSSGSNLEHSKGILDKLDASNSLEVQSKPIADITILSD